jgi:WD40 repeat protein
MLNLKNENLLKSTFESCSCIQLLYSKLNNKIICDILLRIKSYEQIYTSIGSSKTFLDGDHGYINSFIKLDDKTLISVNRKNINLRNLDTLQCYRTIENINEAKIYSILKLSNDHIACSTMLDFIIFGQSFTCLKTISELSGHQNLLELSNGNIAIVNNQNFRYELKILDPKNDYKVIKSLTAHTYYITCLYNLGGDKLASGSYDSKIKIWDVSYDLICLKSLSGHNGAVFSLFFEEKYALMFSGSSDKTIKVWNIDYQCVRTIVAHDDRVICLLLLPGGFFASASDDMKIKIWRIKDYQCINTLKGHESVITSLFQIGDNRIASASFKEIIIWG